MWIVNVTAPSRSASRSGTFGNRCLMRPPGLTEPMDVERSASTIVAFWLVVMWSSIAAVASVPSDKAMDLVPRQRTAITVYFAGHPIAGPASRLRGYRVITPLIEGTTVLPLGNVFNALGATVTAPSANEVVIVQRRPVHELDLAVDSRLARVDGRFVKMDVAPQRIEHTTFVPLRIVAESMGVGVAWIRPNAVAVYGANRSRSNAMASPPSNVPSPSQSRRVECCKLKKTEDPNPYWRLALLLLLFIAEIAGLCWLARRVWPSWGVLAQVGLAWLGLAGATLHAFPIASKEGDPYPVADAVTQAWLLFVIVAYFMPRITRLKLFGGELQVVREDIRELEKTRADEVAALKEAQTRSEEFLASASDSLVKLTNAIQQTQTPDDVAKLVATYAERRMAELSSWLNLPDEKIRSAVWLYNQSSSGLRFFTSDEKFDQPTLQHVFTRGDGLISWCFEENKILSVADAQKAPGFKAIPGARVFHGLLLIPIRWGDKAVGVLSIDRDKAQPFDPAASRIGQVVANNIGVALLEADERRRMIASS